ncbi:hypothetical protein ACMU_03725 [Actibacterium mucosum KCTC 23349]|uniref:Uncharacterized protein n=1 Tax=Actibacterium mucosum KCTC 23349 TaxID=1454373 RepID=A0A037ZHA7_9RHOB|nr:alpha/beta fold hydrolase [Actibacterium mucosum]KAJ54205.1 hypothetical protein ACMU_03725 [Actibacterium mucosum KCTC 23349]
MPLVKINAVGTSIVSPTGVAPEPLLHRAIADSPRHTPIVIMVHGFKFSPRRKGRNPHNHILSPAPESRDRKAISWPRHLGFTGKPGEGVALAFGWQADGDIWRAYDTAQNAGVALADLCILLQEMAPHRPIHFFAHSLGARVALAALRALPAHSIDRMVLMAPAELSRTACAAMNSPAGQTAQVLAITSRENDLFDFLFEGLVGLSHGPDRTLTHATRGTPPNLATLQIDHPQTLAALGDLGHRVAPSRRKICHWSPYLRPGMFPLYRAFLSGKLPFNALKNCQRSAQSPRWSRLLPALQAATLLPAAGKSPS